MSFKLFWCQRSKNILGLSIHIHFIIRWHQEMVRFSYWVYNHIHFIKWLEMIQEGIHGRAHNVFGYSAWKAWCWLFTVVVRTELSTSQPVYLLERLQSGWIPNVLDVKPPNAGKPQARNKPLLPNEVCQWWNFLGCDHWLLAGTPTFKNFGFCDLLGVAIAPVSKKLAVKSKRIINGYW